MRRNRMGQEERAEERRRYEMRREDWISEL
jgi:hypothetical protein